VTVGSNFPETATRTTEKIKMPSNAHQIRTAFQPFRGFLQKLLNLSSFIAFQGNIAAPVVVERTLAKRRSHSNLASVARVVDGN
jgi:hypothetical protein